MDFTKIRLKGLTDVDLHIVGASPTDPYILKQAEGLGPPGVDVSIVKSSTGVGYYQGRRPQSRELVFQIGLNPDFSIGQTSLDLRETLYGLLTPGLVEPITVEIRNETVAIAAITGYVKQLEAVLFTKDPEVQLVISCVEALFEAPNVVETTVFSPSNIAFNITNTGTAASGFDLEMRFANVAVDCWVGLANKYMHFTFNTGYGDNLLQVRTTPGDRWVGLNNYYKPQWQILSADSSWLELHGGVNAFETSGTAFTSEKLQYKPKFWGV